MKLISLFALLVCLISCVGALPLPTPPSTRNKGKGRAPATPPLSRPHTQTPATDPDVPLPGRNHVHNDLTNKIFTAYYGDDKLPEHMGHLQRNQALHPGNRQPMRLATKRERKNNRGEALKRIPSGGKYRNTNDKRVRDEKHIAMLFNKDHSRTTTVEYLPTKESHVEGGFTGSFSKALRMHPGSKGQLRPNPGWLTLNSHQRIGHEAPAALLAQTFRSEPKKIKFKPAKWYGREKTPKAPPGTNLVPGRVGPPGHLWHPNTAGASHAGVPALVRDSHTRQPMRPQDHDHYMRQQAEAHAHAQAALQRPATPAPHPHPGPPTGHSKTNSDLFQENLAKFNAQHAPTAANALRGSSEAPGRMQTHTTPHAAPAILPPNHAAPVPAAHPHQPAPVPAAHPHQPAPVPAAHPHQPAPGPSRPPPPKAGKKKTGKK